MGGVLKKEKFNNILEIGCGSADNLIPVKKERLGIRVVGFDTDAVKIEGTKGVLKADNCDIKLMVGDATSPFPFKDKSFDIVLSAAVLMLIDTRISTETAIETVKEMMRVAKKKIILMEPSKVFNRIKQPFEDKEIEITEVTHWPGITHQDIGYLAVIKL